MPCNETQEQRKRIATEVHRKTQNRIHGKRQKQTDHRRKTWKNTERCIADCLASLCEGDMVMKKLNIEH
jgi:isocitrate lyase